MIVLRCHVLLNSWALSGATKQPPNPIEIGLRRHRATKRHSLAYQFILCFFECNSGFFSDSHFYDLVYILVLGFRSWKIMKGRKNIRAKYTTYVIRDALEPAFNQTWLPLGKQVNNVCVVIIIMHLPLATLQLHSLAWMFCDNPIFTMNMSLLLSVVN